MRDNYALFARWENQFQFVCVDGMTLTGRTQTRASLLGPGQLKVFRSLLMHTRVRLCVPLPQLRVHGVHVTQADQLGQACADKKRFRQS